MAKPQHKHPSISLPIIDEFASVLPLTGSPLVTAVNGDIWIWSAVPLSVPTLFHDSGLFDKTYMQNKKKKYNKVYGHNKEIRKKSTSLLHFKLLKKEKKRNV